MGIYTQDFCPLSRDRDAWMMGDRPIAEQQEEGTSYRDGREQVF